MAVVKVTYMARVMVSVIKSGGSPLKEEELAIAVLDTEQAMNNMQIPEVTEKKAVLRPYIRVHLLEEVERKGDTANGDNKDQDLA